MSRPFRKIWGIPALLALATAFGLTAALLGTGLWAILAWLAMAAPLAIILWKIKTANKI